MDVTIIEASRPQELVGLISLQSVESESTHLPPLSAVCALFRTSLISDNLVKVEASSFLKLILTRIVKVT